MAMARDGLLAKAGVVGDAPPPDQPLPVGSGRAAFAVVNPSELWGYADALVDDRADADLAVSALPGETGPFAPVLGDVWVLSSSATEAESSAAGELVDWLAADEQQAAMVSLTDLLPLSTRAADLPVLAPYWERLPLLRQAEDVVAEHATATASWGSVPGAGPTASHLLGAAAFGGRPLAEAWALLIRALAHHGWEQDAEDARTYAECLLGADVGRASIADCVQL